MGGRPRDLLGVKSEAFTLVEILMAMAMVGVLIGTIYSVFVSSNRSYQTQDSVANAQQAVRIGLDFIVRDIRMAGLDPVGTAGAGIEEATTTKLRFTEDNDVDGVIENENRERITYEYCTVDDKDNPNTLRLGLYEGTGSESWQSLIDNVRALSFTYLDGDGTPTDALSEIRAVAISMTCEGTAAQEKPLMRTLNTKVRCRNL